MTKVLSTQRIALFFLAAIAIALQIQISLFAEGDYLGLRINLADFLLPLAGLFVLVTLLSKKSHWPQWINKYTHSTLLALLAILTIALINGYFYIGEWSSWALINKYFGFFILMSYFYLGGWLVTNFGQNQVLRTFTRFFLGFFIVTLVLSIIDVIQQPYTETSLWIGDFAWDGFMANRNAYMVIAIFAIVSLLTHSLYSKAPLPFWCSSLLWTIIPTFAIYNASRTGWIFGALIICAYLIKTPIKFMKTRAPFLVLGTALTFLTFNFISHGEVKLNHQYKYLTAALQQTNNQEELQYLGDQNRYIALEDGLELYQQSNPILGAGLGAYKPFQIEKRGEYINIIDWSTLWLLTETGILGLAGFSAFFLLCLAMFFKRGIKEKSPYHTTLFFFLILIIAMSFLHELLYTRFLWFALGLGMAAPLPPKEEKARHR